MLDPSLQAFLAHLGLHFFFCSGQNIVGESWIPNVQFVLSFRKVGVQVRVNYLLFLTQRGAGSSAAQRFCISILVFCVSAWFCSEKLSSSPRQRRSAGDTKVVGDTEKHWSSSENNNLALTGCNCVNVSAQGGKKVSCEVIIHVRERVSEDLQGD